MAQEVIWTLKTASGDYSAAGTWESAIQSDVTSATSAAIPINASAGTMVDGESLTGATSGATATLAGIVPGTDDWIYVTGVSGTFEAGGETIEKTTDSGITVTSTGSPDFNPTLVLECYSGAYAETFIVDGSTTSLTDDALIIIRAEPTSNRHDGIDPASAVRFTSSGSEDAIIKLSDVEVRVEYIGCISSYGGSNDVATFSAQAGGSATNFVACIGEFTGGATASVCFKGENSRGYFFSCLGIGGVDGFAASSQFQPFRAWNCVAKDNTNGFNTSAGTGASTQLYNCIAFGNTDSYNIPNVDVVDYNGAEDGLSVTIPGTNTVDIDLDSGDFEGSASNNMQPSSSSDCDDAGNWNAGNAYNRDIVGVSYATSGAINLGCWATTAGGGLAAIAYHHYQRNIG